MAVSTGIGFDLSAALAQADKLDRYMDKWAKQSESISANMRQAMTAKASGDMQGFTDNLSKITSALSQLSGMKLSPNVDSSKVSELANILSGVIDTMTTMSKLPLFDTQGLYNTNKGLAETSATLSGIRDKISDLKNEWVNMENFSAPINKKTGNAFGENTKTYKQAEADYKASIEKQLQAEIEKEAIAKKELDWAKKTQDEKAAYIQKKLNEILRAEQKNVNEVRREYSRLLSDWGKVETRKKQYAEAESAGQEGGIAVSPEVQTQYQEVLRQEQNLVERKKEIETQYWSEVTDIAERFVLQQSQKEIEEFKRRAQEKKKIDDAQFESYLKTPEGAISLSDDAKSINEEKEAIKYLIQARDNLSKSTEHYDTIIADLNNRIQKHRISVEELTKAEQNENTLQPKIRNEYAQLLKEMDKIADAKKRLAGTEAYKKGDTQSLADMNALDARYNDLAQRRLTIEQNAQGQLDEVVRQHDALRAQESINATIKEEEEKKRIREEYAKKYGAISSTDAQSVIGGSKATENLRQAEKAVQDLKEARAKLNKGDADYKQTLDALNKEIARQEKYIDKIINAEKRRAEAKKLLEQRRTESYSGAMDYSRQARTVNELTQAIKYLEAARNKEDLKTKQGKKNYQALTDELNRQQAQYNKLAGKVKESSRSMIDTAGQLKRAFGLLFSVSQMRGYFNKLVEIRGEFEMQHRSLQVLIQDQDKANEIWDKTVALAVKSPFRVKELVTYTKQLASYRVEADKLYETNKMLADVSAGLGVDMNRLILAYGQVKAANYLRGTELRQFSEAGVNILQELADNFSKVKDRAVSIGEVFEMVSKRMVSFKDVDEVFKNITSEGGIFYQMQEKQSETLKGMLMNLSDSIDLMFDQIGMVNDSALKNVVLLTKSLVDNWRELVPLVTAAMFAMVGNVTFKSFAKLVNLIIAGVKAMKAFVTASKLATATTPWGAIGTAIGAVIGLIIGLTNNTNKFKAAMNEVENNVSKGLNESIDLYRKLATRVQDVTRTEKERAQALDNLQSKFAEILPDQYTELTYVHQLGDNYREVNEAMLAYYDAKARAQKKDRIESLYEEDIATDTTDLQTAVTNAITGNVMLQRDRKIQQQMLAYSNGIVSKMIEDMKKGIVKATSENDLRKELINRFAEFMKIPYDTMSFYLSTDIFTSAKINKNLKELRENIQNLNRDLESITGMPYATVDEAMASEWVNNEKANVDEVKQAYIELLNIYDEYSKMTDDERAKVIMTTDGKEMAQGEVKLADARKKLEDAKKQFPEYEDLFEDNTKAMLESAENGSFAFASQMQSLQQSFINGIIPIVKAAAKENEDLGSDIAKGLVDNFVEEIKKSSDKLNLDDMQTALINAINEVSEKSKVSIDKFTSYIPKAGESVTDVRERLKGDIEGLTRDLERWNNSVSTGLDKTNKDREKYLFLNDEDVDEEKKRLEGLILLNRLLGEAEKKTTGGGRGGDETMERLKRIIEVIKQMNREYEKLNKTFSSEKSVQDVLSSYDETIKELGLDISKIDFTTKKGTANALYALLGDPKYAAHDYVVEIRKAFSLMAAEMNIAEGELVNQTLFDRIQKIFDNFNLAKDLKKMGFSEELMKSLFNLDYLDLNELRQKLVDEFAKGAGYKEPELIKQLKRGFQDIDWDIVSDILGKDQMEEIRKRLQEISKYSDEEYQENAKKYLEYAKKAIGERAKIQIDALKKIKKIEETFAEKPDDSDETKATKKQLKSDAIDNVKKESEQAIKKLDWEEFQKSDVFVSLFKDLDNASSALLDHTMQKLHDFKEQWKDMPLEDVRQIVSKINELETQLAERNPWSSYAKSKEMIDQAMKSTTFESEEAAQTAKKGGRRNFFDALELENVYQQQKIDNAQKEATIIETVLRIKQDMATEDDKMLVTQEEYQGYMKMNVDELDNELKAQKGIVISSEKTLSANQSLLSERQKQIVALNKQADVLNKSVSMANDLYGAVKDLVSVLDEDNPAMLFADMGMSILSSIPQMLTLIAQINAATLAAEGMGAAMNMAMGIIGLIVMGIQLITQVISAVVNYTNQIRENEIEVMAQQVERLQKSYDKLAQSLDDVATASGLDAMRQKLTAMNEQMIVAQQNKIALMRDDKDVKKGIEAQRKFDLGLGLTDAEREALTSDAYKEYLDAIDTLGEMEQNYADSMEEIFSKATDGILDNAFDDARSFTDAWHDAFLETGNGLTGLEESFDDMFKNLVRQQATLQITSLFTDKWKEQLEKLTSNTNELSPEALNEWADSIKESFPELNKLLKEFFGNFDFSGSGSGLSGLQKGIQGITEATAEIIAAYLNSIRQYIATQNEQINMIVSRLDISGEENPMLSQLRIIATRATEINTLLNRLTKSGHSQGGVGLKVFMD